MRKAAVQEIVLVSGSSVVSLAKEISQEMGVQRAEVLSSVYPDGERWVRVEGDLAAKHVVIVQSLAHDPDRYLVELALLADAARRAGAKNIVAALPYYGYARQDRRAQTGEAVGARVVADILSVAGITHLVTVDLHAEQIEGFFSIPMINLHASEVLVEGVQRVLADAARDLVVVAPDFGSIKLARRYAAKLGAELAIIDKERISATEVQIASLIGDVANKNVLLADDMCATGGTLELAAKACREKGAKKVYAVVSHPLFVGDALDRIKKGPIEKLIVANTILLPSPQSDEVQQVSVANLLAGALLSLIA